MPVFIGILVAFTAIVIAFFKWRFQFWKRKNLTYPEPSIPFGNLQPPFWRSESPAESVAKLYNELKKSGAKHGGVYVMVMPNYMPIDLEYVKNILVKDFSHFVDRGLYYNEKDDPLSAHLFALGGQKWRNLRVKLSPTFTSGKMKMMFPTLIECAGLFVKVMDGYAREKASIDIKDALGRFTTDIIGSCAFGLNCHTLNESESEFRKYGKKVFEQDKWRLLLFTFAISFPRLGQALRIRTSPKETSDFFMGVVKDTVEYREKNNTVRNDFMQILIDLKNRKLDHEIEGEHDGKGLTLEEVAAQCFVFFIAGFETSSTTMTMALLEMCKNEEIQEKLREEVVRVTEKHDGKITYEALSEMKYMEQVIDESLRMYPPVPFITRKCVKDYKVPNTDVLIENGTRCMISIMGIHRDEEYYPNPNVFDPDRFSEENRKNLRPHSFIPFGDGPRLCIGMRFGLMQTKVGLAYLLRNFRFTLAEKTKLPIKLDPYAFVTTVQGGVWLKAERVK